MALTNHILPDSPTNNFATWNPLYEANGNVTYSEGNLKHSCTSTTADISTSTLAVSAGKYYWEILFTSSNLGSLLGIENRTENSGYGGTRSAWRSSGSLDNLTGSVSSGWSSNNVLGVLLNLDNGEVTFYENNLSKGTLTIVNWVAGSQYLAWVGNDSSTLVANFGQDPTFAGSKNTPATVNGVTGPFAPSGDAAGTAGLFYYPPPAGAKALNTANLPEMTPDVDDDTPQDYFKAVKWTGHLVGDAMTAWDGTTGTVNVGFQPDLVWLKSRNNASWAHFLQDGVRGYTNFLKSNTTDQESTTSPHIVSGVHTDGFYIKTNGNSNNSGDTYCSWCWKAGGNSNTFNINGTGYSTYSALQTANTSLPASSTSGMIVPSGMSINTEAGFSIVKYTGTGANATVPHGLSSAPEVIIVKNLDDTGGRSWIVYHHKATSTPQEDYLLLNESDSSGTQPWYWNDTYPTSSVFSIGIANAVNYSSQAHIAYCWHSVAGYSAFGSFTGNLSADGPFVYTGFKPAYVVYKKSSSSSYLTAWNCFDNQRVGYNPSNYKLYLNEADYDRTGEYIDLLSNGFKLRTAGNYDNEDGKTYIYMAFAEQPFKFSNAR